MPPTSKRRRAEVDLPADELLIDGEERPAGIAWPLAVDRWLDARLAQARATGMTTSRKELAAALMTADVPDDDGLAVIIRGYRQLRVRDLLALSAETNVVTFHRQPPGPRTRRTNPSGGAT